MSDQQNRQPESHEQSWEEAQSTNQSQSRQSGNQSQNPPSANDTTGQRHSDKLFQGSDDASRELTEGGQSTGSSEPASLGQDSDRTGATSVTGQDEAENEEANLSKFDFDRNLDRDRG